MLRRAPTDVSNGQPGTLLTKVGAEGRRRSAGGSIRLPWFVRLALSTRRLLGRRCSHVRTNRATAPTVAPSTGNREIHHNPRTDGAASAATSLAPTPPFRGQPRPPRGRLSRSRTTTGASIRTGTAPPPARSATAWSSSSPTWPDRSHTPTTRSSTRSARLVRTPGFVQLRTAPSYSRGSAPDRPPPPSRCTNPCTTPARTGVRPYGTRRALLSYVRADHRPDREEPWETPSVPTPPPRTRSATRG